MGALYSETVRFSPILVGLYFASALLLLFALTLPGVAAWSAFLLVGILLLAGACFGKLTVEVEAEELVVGFGVFGWPGQRIRRSEIVSARPVTYRPIRQFGGWGLRCGTFEGVRTSVYSVRGDRGLLLVLLDQEALPLPGQPIGRLRDPVPADPFLPVAGEFEPRLGAEVVGTAACDRVAEGILEAQRRLSLDMPIVIRLVGTNEERAREMLADTDLIACQTMSEAAKRAVEISARA